MALSSYEIARLAARASDARKAQDIVLLDLTELSDVCDYFLICTGGSTPQVDAIVDEIRETLRSAAQESPLSSEGKGGSGWMLLDYGSLVVHVFKPEVREFYRLERLWAEAPRVDFGLGARDEGGDVS
ncbi:ribosome silencing factor [Olsenella urininfantis]|uniref:ribosome silencing factor n=1 Tax=Olsenella urininfantis TaxID=1871033 RepID=UPI00098588DC|nr:ribosome silencing factor [Olsenella urininfantis]